MIQKKSGNVNPFGASYTADAVNVRPEASFKVFRDQVFSISKRFTIAKSTSVDIVFNPTLHTGILTFLPVFFSAGLAGPIHIDLYAGTTNDEDGTLWPPTNRNFDSAVVGKGYMRLNPTIISDGAKGESEFLLPSNGTAAIASAGGQVEDSLIINLDTAFKYMFRLTNIDTVTDATCQISSSWFELPPI